MTMALLAFGDGRPAMAADAAAPGYCGWWQRCIS
jgi:hypothetical protein